MIAYLFPPPPQIWSYIQLPAQGPELLEEQVVLLTPTNSSQLQLLCKTKTSIKENGTFCFEL